MSTGFWVNSDGLPLQFGTQKAIPEMGGDFLLYGENREIEQYIPFVPTTWATGAAGAYVSVPGVQTSAFSGSGTPIAAGIQSMTALMPLQLTAPQSASGSALTLSNTQVFIERVELLCVQTVAPLTTTMTVGLVTTSSPANSSSATVGSFVQVTPNAGAQLIGATTPLTVNAAVGTAGAYTLFNLPTTPGAAFVTAGVPVTTTGNSGAWVGTNMPLVTNSLVPLPSNAFISTLVSGTPTAGLMKMRIKYFIYGNISY